MIKILMQQHTQQNIQRNSIIRNVHNSVLRPAMQLQPIDLTHDPKRRKTDSPPYYQTGPTVPKIIFFFSQISFKSR
jgi:hypothetical protein